MITVITGPYGAGKTEFAINFALTLKKNFKHVAIADLDVINVYFRSRERLAELKDVGIDVIGSSIIEATGSDLPAVNIAAISAMKGKTDTATIVDLAGSENGLKVIQTIKESIGVVEVLFIANCYREGSQSKDELIQTIKTYELKSGFKVTGLVNNSHLLHQTTKEDVVYGQEIISKVADELKIPIKYTQIKEQLYKDIQADNTVLLGEPVLFESLKNRQSWL